MRAPSRPGVQAPTVAWRLSAYFFRRVRTASAGETGHVAGDLLCPCRSPSRDRGSCLAAGWPPRPFFFSERIGGEPSAAINR